MHHIEADGEGLRAIVYMTCNHVGMLTVGANNSSSAKINFKRTRFTRSTLLPNIIDKAKLPP